jgi:hypothetical protein
MRASVVFMEDVSVGKGLGGGGSRGCEEVRRKGGDGDDTVNKSEI